MNLVQLKSVLYLALLAVALVKTAHFVKERAKTKKRFSDQRAELPRLAGKVVQMLPENQGHLVKMMQGVTWVWIWCEDPDINIGDELEFEATGSFDAYESKVHQMAFEKVWFARRV